MRLVLRRCAWLAESLYPWRVRRGPLDVIVEDGVITSIESSVGGGSAGIDCRGELGVAPCFYDALYLPRAALAGRAWIDEVLEKPLRVSAGDARRLARLGFCRGLAYALGSMLELGGVTLEVPRLIVRPSGELMEAGGERFILAATPASRRSVYGLRSKRGSFAVEYLERMGLLAEDLVVVGAWVASWELLRLREAGARVAYAPWLMGLLRGGPPPAPSYIDVLVAGSGGVASAWSVVEALAIQYSTCYWGRGGLEAALRVMASTIELLGSSPRVSRGHRADLQLVEASGPSLEELVESRPRVVGLIASGRLVSLGVA